MNQSTASTNPIEWNPKVPQSFIRRLYQNDARGIVDDELIDEVGFALYTRCQSILLVHARHVQCPLCNYVFATGWQWHKRYDAMQIHCPHCASWATTGRHYRESIQSDGLAASNALPAFQTFVDRYPRTTDPRERVVLIDRLIHEFHYGLSQMPDGSLQANPLPHETTGTNLIIGKHDEVVAFLDELTYGDATTPELSSTRDTWRARAADMRQRRSQR